MAKIIDKYSLKDNTYFQIAKANPKDFLDVEIGDSKQPDFYPQIKIKRWDNEVNFSARLIHDEIKPIISTEEDRIKWQGQKIEAKFYDLPASNELPDGGYEMEVILKEKPKTNKLQFTIQTKGVDFFYQPEITDEEALQIGIDKGVTLSEAKRLIRPENVIGSYAIYISENKINYAAGKEYRCGKFGHIYRPRIEDSAGNWCWGALNIDTKKGLLTVTIPQEFLDKAVYPVRHAAGTTVGYTSNGASTEWWYANNTRGNTYTFSAGNIQKISSYAYEDYSGDLYTKSYLVRYSTGAITGNISSGTLVPTGSKTWYDATFSANPTVEAADYRIVNVVSVGTANYGIGYDSGLTAYYNTTPSQDYDSPVDWDDYYTNSNGDKKYSIYATYEEGGAGVTKTIQAKGRIKKLNNSRTVQAKGRVKQLNFSKTIQSKARIEISNQLKTIQTKARIKKLSVSRAIQSRARIQSETQAYEVSGKSRILHPSEMWSDIWSVEILTGTYTATIRAKARIKKLNNSVSLSAKARIKQPNIIKTVQAKARIEQSNIIKSIQAKGRVESTEDQTIQAKGRVETTSAKTVQAKGRIEQADITKSIQAKADIKQLSRTKTVQAKARVKQANLSKTVQAKGRIEQARAQTVQSKARVKSLAVAKSISAKARIGAGNFKFIQAKGRTKRTFPAFIETDFYGIEHFESMDYNYWLYSGVHVGVGQSFYAYSGGQLNNVTFYMKKIGAPTGNMVAKLYTHSGTFGTSSVPGSLLATSDTIDVTILSATRFNLINFLFTGAEEVQLTQDEYYVVTVEYTGGNSSNHLVVSLAADYPEHYGNCTIKGGSPESAWSADPNADLFFYVFLAAGNLSAKARIKQEDIVRSVQAKAKIAYLNVAKTIQAKARLKQFSLAKTIGAKARIGIPGDMTIDARATIKKWGVSRVASVKARIEQQNINYGIQAKGRIVHGRTAAIQAKARIKQFGSSQLVTAKAAIKQFNLDESIQAKARILHSESATAQAKARIKTTTAETIQAKARLKQQAVAYSVQAKAQIATLGGEITIEAKGRIKQEDVSASVQAKARIEKSDITKSVQAKARIESSDQAKTIQAKARIERAGEVETVQSKARIKKLGLAKTASARARIWAFASGYVKMRRGDQLYPLVLFSSNDFQALRSVEQSGIITLDNKDDFQTLRSQDQIGIKLLKDNRIL